MNDNLHKEHRNRLREMYYKGGMKSMAQHQILELMLFYAIPRIDTNPIAHRLIDKFGSLGGVLEAETEDLEEVEGVGKSTAIYLKLFLDVFRQYELSKTETLDQLMSIYELGKFLKPRFIGEKREVAYLLSLDSRMSAIACDLIAVGSINSTRIRYRDVAAIALKRQAIFCVLAHNHPGATAIPSSDDKNTTVNIQKLLKELGIILIDHLIFADDDFTSMSQSGYLTQYLEF